MNFIFCRYYQILEVTLFTQHQSAPLMLKKERQAAAQ
jgi:hypothetical protein